MVVPKVQSIFLLGVGIGLTLLMSIPILGLEWGFLTVSDQSLTEGYVLDVFRTGSFDGTYSLLKSWYTHPRLYLDGLVLHYPLYLYAVGVTGVGLVGTAAFSLLPIVMAAGLVYLLFLLAQEIVRALGIDPSRTEVSVPVWLAGFAALAPSWLNGFRFELLFIVLVVAGIYWAIRMYRTRAVSDAVLSITVLSFAACIRQNYTLFMVGVLGVVVIQAICMTPRKHLWKSIITCIGIPLVIVGSFYAVLINTTGTISYYSESGYSVIDEYLFSPDYLEESDLDRELNEAVNREELFERFNSGFQDQYPSLQRLVSTDQSIRSMYDRININLPINIIAFLTLVVGSSMIWIFRRSGIWYLMIGLSIPYIAVLAVYTSNPRYAHVQYLILMLAGMTCVALLVPMLSRMQRYIVIVLLVVMSVYGVILPYRQDVQTITSSFWGVKDTRNANAMEPLNDWILENTDESDRIFTSFQREISLHTGRETIWDSRIWFVEGLSTTLRLWDQSYGAKYIIIKDSDLKSLDTYRGPADVIEKSTLYSLMQGTRVFEEVYRYQDIVVYEYTKPEAL